MERTIMKSKIVIQSEPAKELNGVKLRNRTLKFKVWDVNEKSSDIKTVKIVTNGKKYI